MEKGLPQDKARTLLKQYGKNEIVAKKSFSALSSFLSQFPTLINGILFAGAIFSAIIGNYIDASFIFAILILSAIFGFVQEYNAEKSLEKLKNIITPLSRVFRDGKETQIETSEIVPGDVVVLSEGERIPADGKIIVSRHLEIDESILTGESIPVVKNQNDQGFSGTLVSKGRGFLLVEKTGMDTRFGQIAKTLSTIETDKTPLQKNLSSLGKVISVIAILIALSLIPIGLAQGRDLAHLVLLSISAGVSAIPEGLPAVITIALAIGTSKMAKRKAIVRKMSAVETLGAVQVILSDKTGTLTQNNMRVRDFYLYKKDGLEMLLKACVIGNTASLIQKGEADKFEAVGDKTDSSLLVFAKEKVKDLKILTDDGKVVDEFVFDPKTKLITTVWEEQGKKYVFIRGAFEKILANSTLNEKEKRRIEKKFEGHAKKGYRVIAFAYKKHTGDTSNRKELEKNIDLLGFVGIYDPPRIEAAASIQSAREAGIKTVMVTGDNELTALTIAKEVGLIEKDETVLTGEELDKLSDEELKKIILKISVFARTKPEDKLRLVKVYKSLGFVVGVTGDGVNDALALKKADVGIAMGETGTDVAKEASDIVLSDDNYSTLIRAVIEGRTIYRNILKSIIYLLSSNLSELSLIVFAALLKLPDPLLPTQILWINLVTDGLPALALASDNKESSILNEKPRDPKERILTPQRIAFILIIGLTLASALILLFNLLLQTKSEIYSKTIIFNTLIFSHLALAFLVRGRAMFKFNKLLVVSVILTVILQFTITTVPFFKEIFKLGLR
ncbi:MAG: cation-translocating P-type ATPase [Candidatus Levybacteria bacterium]|nr:cation-translocating P-type ATPase [Candidatus Levybacteria bacterium]